MTVDGDDVDLRCASLFVMASDTETQGVGVQDLDARWLGCDLPADLRERFHLGFCRSTLRPVLHGLPPGRCPDEDWRAYITANELHARHATLVAAPTSSIWVQDYRLMLVADAMRAYGHRGPIGLHLHVPFPSPEQLDLLPWNRELLDRLCAFDLVSFETESWASNFAACLDLPGIDRRERRPAIDVLPSVVDRNALEGARDENIARLRDSLGTGRLILGIDRLEYLSGIPERLLAFEELLEQYPEWRRRVMLLQIVMPSDESKRNRELRNHIEGIVGRINGVFGETDWMPVTYLHRSYPRSVLAQLYRCADVALVTPICAVFEMTAMEFAATQDLERPGVLMLSRFAFGVAELVDAVVTNPHHTFGFATDLDRALRMPIDERRRRAAGLASAIVAEPVRCWATRFLDRLGATRSVSQLGRCG